MRDDDVAAFNGALVTIVAVLLLWCIVALFGLLAGCQALAGAAGGLGRDAEAAGQLMRQIGGGE